MFRLQETVRKVQNLWRDNAEKFAYLMYFLCSLTGTKYSSYESSFVVPISTSPSFFFGRSLLLCLPFVGVGFFKLLLLFIFINSKLTASVGSESRRRKRNNRNVGVNQCDKCFVGKSDARKYLTC